MGSFILFILLILIVVVSVVILLVKVVGSIKLIKDGKTISAEALFDTGAGRSYVDKRIAEFLGYEKYDKPVYIDLAVKNLKAKVIGYLVARVEIEGHLLPEVEVFGVIDGLVKDVIVGLNIIEPYEIILEKDRISFKRLPPTTAIV